MKVLVTGASGFIGSHVVAALAPRHEVIPAVRPALDDPKALFARTKPDAVVHLAWFAMPYEYLVSPRNADSLATSLALAEAALAGGVKKWVGVGTCLEYRASKAARREEDACDPVSPYAAAKHAAFLVTRAFAERARAEMAWARLFHIFGPGEDRRRMVPSIADALRRGERAKVTAGEQVRDYLRVEDVASGIAALVEPGVRGVHNVCSGEAVTLGDVLREIGRITGKSELLAFGERPYAADEEMFLAGDSSKLRKLGWSPKWGLRAGLEDYLR